MDVTCERCGTEYEFDETLLSGRGTSVKCTNCGHVFKVYPKAEAAIDRTTSIWRLRTKDGSADTIDSLRELQRRIALGELTPDDEISRGEEGWKTLGSIPELETFFRSAGVQIPTGRIPSPLPPTPAPPTQTQTSKDSSLPPGRRPRQPTLLGVVPVNVAPAARGTAAGERTSPGTVPAPAAAPAPEAGVVAGAVAETASGAVAEAETVAGAETASGAVAEAETVAGGVAGAETVAGAVAEAETVAGGAAGAETASGAVAESAAETVAETVPGAEPSSRRWESGPAAGAREHAPTMPSSRPPPPQIEDAEFSDVPTSSTHPSTRPSTPPPSYYDDDDIPELPGRGGSPLRWLLLIVIVGGLALVATQWDRVAQLVGVGGDPALIAAALTEGDAGIAQADPEGFANAIEAYRRAVAAGARDVETLAKLSNAHALAAQAQLDDGGSSDDASANVEAAEAHARSAVEADPGDVEAQLARADALRLAGEYGEARELLDGARSMSFSRTPELFRIDALLSAAEAGGGLEHGLRSAKRAVALAPEGITYQLLAARTEIAAGDAASARAALTTILADHPQHPVATQLLGELDQAEAVDAEAEAAAELVAAEASADQADPAAEGSGTDPAATTETEAATRQAEIEKAAAEKAAAEKAAAEKAAAEKAAAEKAAAEKTKAAAGAAGAATPKARAAERQRSPKQDQYDELVEAASDDAFVDGRPPVRGYEWYMRQGRAELAAGNYSRARSFFDSALEARPGSAGAMDGLGAVFTRIEDFKTALRYYRVAAQRGHPDGFFNLGKTYESLGRNEEAVSAYYTYVKRRPKGAHAAAAVSRIKALEPRAKLPPELDPEREPKPEPEPAQESEPTTP